MHWVTKVKYLKDYLVEVTFNDNACLDKTVTKESIEDIQYEYGRVIYSKDHIQVWNMNGGTRIIPEAKVDVWRKTVFGNWETMFVEDRLCDESCADTGSEQQTHLVMVI